MSGTLVLVPAMNVPAYEAGQRGNPQDTFSYDMNRIYPGRADGYLTERVAWAHAQWMKKVADLEISIHSGGAHSYLSETIFVNEDDKSVELAKAMGRGWDVVLSAISPKGNPMAVMLDAGKTGITVELGGRPATSPEEMKRVVATLVEAILNVMRHYGIIAVAVVFSFSIAYIAYRGISSSTMINVAINIIQIVALLIFAVFAIKYRVDHKPGSVAWQFDSTSGEAYQYEFKTTSAMVNGVATDTVVRDADGNPMPKLDAAGKPVPFHISYDEHDATGELPGASECAVGGEPAQDYVGLHADDGGDSDSGGV